MNRKKIILTAVSLLCAVFMAYTDVKVKIVAPTIQFNTGSNDLNQKLDDMFNVATGPGFQAKIDEMQAQADKMLSPYSNQQKMALGFANSNIASAQSATMQGYQGYKIFAVTSGAMIGGQLPSFDPNAIISLADTIKDNPDIYVGAAPSVAFLNVGVNAGKLVGIFSPDLGNTLKDLYFNVKFGVLSYNLPLPVGTIAMNTGNFGFGVNYQILAHSPSLLGGLFMWRGINLATGINYQTNTIRYDVTFDKISDTYNQTVSYGGSYSTTASASFSFTPAASLGIDVSTFSVPLEASTSAQILWLANITLGVGADLSFGAANINASGQGAFTIDSLTLDGTDILSTSKATVTPGSVTVDASTKGIAPTLFRPRVSAGLGLNLGPVKVDVPVYYYFDYGFSAGVSLGFVW